jgi:adenosine deaminase CECR1
MPDATNIADAYLLKAKRVGHGLNLYRYPALADMFAKEKIPLEICPVSNQMLGYTPDLRAHPAVEYIRRGIPVVLGPDDPLVFGNGGLSYDFFMATVYWDLSLADIKQLCMNSITYSATTEKEKAALMDRWQKKWDAFIEKTARSVPFDK